MHSASVIITTYNQQQYVEQAIRSGFDQANESLGIQVVVIDDNSTDGTYEFLLKLQNKYDFSLYQTPQNLGPSAARNLGLKHSSGEWINFLDGDDFLHNHKISRQLAFLDENSHVDICYSDCRLEFESKPTQRLSVERDQHSGILFPKLLRMNVIAIHSAILPRKMAERYPFDEELRNAEDYDFWLRIARDNHHFDYLEEDLVTYRIHNNNLSQQHTLHKFRNIEKVLLRHRGVQSSHGFKRHLAGVRYAIITLQEASEHTALSKLTLLASKVHPRLGVMTQYALRSAT